MSDSIREPSAEREPQVPQEPPVNSSAFDDPVIAAYASGIDRTLLRENLKLTVEERFRKFERFMEYVNGLREAGRQSRTAK